MVENGNNQNSSGKHETKESAENKKVARANSIDSVVQDRQTDPTTLENAED